MDIDRAEGFHDLGNPGQGWFLGRRRGDVVGTWGMWWELWRSVHHGPKLEFSWGETMTPFSESLVIAMNGSNLGRGLILLQSTWHGGSICWPKEWSCQLESCITGRWIAVSETRLLFWTFFRANFVGHNLSLDLPVEKQINHSCSRCLVRKVLCSGPDDRHEDMTWVRPYCLV